MTRLVYSSGPDGRRPSDDGCRRCAADPCRCEPLRSRPAAEQPIRVRRDRSGRRGKTVTVAGPFELSREDARDLLKELKRRCGGGGTLKPGRSGAGEPAFDLEVQGDHADSVVSRLQELGYPAKRSGG